MSLTRTEWTEIWQQVLELEEYLVLLGARPQSGAFKRIQFLKEKIQSVVGQME